MSEPAAVASVAVGHVSRGRRPGFLLVVPATVMVVVFLLCPLAIMFRYSLNYFIPGRFMVDGLTLANYAKFVTDGYYRGVLLTTLGVAALSTALALVAGFPVAYFIARTRSRRFKGLLIMLVVMPLLMGNAVRMAGWLVVLGDRGLVNTILAWLGLVTVPLTILYTSKAVVIGLTSVLLPFMIITLQSVIEGIDRSVEEAALNLGASPFTTFRRVVLPLAMPGVLAGTTLCFILAMNAYATPVLLGGPKFKMMGPAVYDQVAKVSNWPFGAALAFVLMAVTLSLTGTSNAIVQRRSGR